MRNHSWPFFKLKLNENNDDNGIDGSAAIDFAKEVFETIDPNLVESHLAVDPNRTQDIANKLLQYALFTPENPLLTAEENLAKDIIEIRNEITTNSSWLEQLDAWAASQQQTKFEPEIPFETGLSSDLNDFAKSIFDGTAIETKIVTLLSSNSSKGTHILELMREYIDVNGINLNDQKQKESIIDFITANSNDTKSSTYWINYLESWSDARKTAATPVSSGNDTTNGTNVDSSADYDNVNIGANNTGPSSSSNSGPSIGQLSSSTNVANNGQNPASSQTQNVLTVAAAPANVAASDSSQNVSTLNLAQSPDTNLTYEQFLESFTMDPNARDLESNYTSDGRGGSIFDINLATDTFREYCKQYGNPLQKVVANSNLYSQYFLSYNRNTEEVIVLSDSQKRENFNLNFEMISRNFYKDLPADQVEFLPTSLKIARSILQVGKDNNVNYQNRAGDSAAYLGTKLFELGVTDLSDLVVNMATRQIINGKTNQVLSVIEDNNKIPGLTSFEGDGCTDFYLNQTRDGHLLLQPVWQDTSDAKTIKIVIAVAGAFCGVPPIWLTAANTVVDFASGDFSFKNLAINLISAEVSNWAQGQLTPLVDTGSGLIDSIVVNSASQGAGALATGGDIKQAMLTGAFTAGMAECFANLVNYSNSELSLNLSGAQKAAFVKFSTSMILTNGDLLTSVNAGVNAHQSLNPDSLYNQWKSTLSTNAAALDQNFIDLNAGPQSHSERDYFSDGSSSLTFKQVNGEITTIHTIFYNADGSISSSASIDQKTKVETSGSHLSEIADASNESHGGEVAIEADNGIAMTNGSTNQNEQNLVDNTNPTKGDINSSSVDHKISFSPDQVISLYKNIELDSLDPIRMRAANELAKMVNGNQDYLASISEPFFRQIVSYINSGNAHLVPDMLRGAGFEKFSEPSFSPSSIVEGDSTLRAAKPGELTTGVALDAQGNLIWVTSKIEIVSSKWNNENLYSNYQKSDGSFNAEFSSVKPILDLATMNASVINDLVIQGGGQLIASGEFGGVGYTSTTNPGEQALELVKSIAFLNGLTAGAYGFANKELIAAAKAYAPSEFENAESAGSLGFAAATAPISLGATTLKMIVSSSGINAFAELTTSLASGDSFEVACMKAGINGATAAVATGALSFLVKGISKPFSIEAVEAISSGGVREAASTTDNIIATNAMSRFDIGNSPVNGLKVLESSSEAGLGFQRLEIGVINDTDVFIKVTKLKADGEMATGATRSLSEIENEIEMAKKLGDEGLAPEFVGTRISADGYVSIVTKFEPGTHLDSRLIINPNNVTTAHLDSIMALAQKADDLGLVGRDIQFRLTGDGRAVLVDLEGIGFAGNGSGNEVGNTLRDMANRLLVDKIAAKFETSAYKEIGFSRLDAADLLNDAGLLSREEKFHFLNRVEKLNLEDAIAFQSGLNKAHNDGGVGAARAFIQDWNSSFATTHAPADAILPNGSIAAMTVGGTSGAYAIYVDPMNPGPTKVQFINGNYGTSSPTDFVDTLQAFVSALVEVGPRGPGVGLENGNANNLNPKLNEMTGGLLGQDYMTCIQQADALFNSSFLHDLRSSGYQFRVFDQTNKNESGGIYHAFVVAISPSGEMIRMDPWAGKVLPFISEDYADSKGFIENYTLEDNRYQNLIKNGVKPGYPSDQIFERKEAS